MRELVREGVWIYDKTSPKSVYIIRSDSDFWYDQKAAVGILDEHDRPELNQEGRLYYLCYKSHPTDIPQWVDSVGHLSLEEAIEHANNKFADQIKWRASTSN